MSTVGIARDFKKRRFWQRFGTQSLSCFGSLGVLAGIVSALFPKALPPIGWALFIGALVASTLYGLFRAWPRPVQQAYSAPNTEIRVVEGDLFEQGDDNIVVGMADTFDTEIPHIIEEHGIQAQLLTRVYKNDLKQLNRDLAKALAGHKVDHSFKPEDQKPGNQDAYPLGTVVTIEPQIRKLYFCVAYSRMDRRNVAQSSVDGVWHSLYNLWDEVRNRGNGDPVSIAIIGGGQSRISQHFPKQDSIRFIALSFMFASRERFVTRRLTIVVRKEDVPHLDMLELQAFLKSLRPS